MPQSSPHYVPSPPALAGPCQPFSCLCTTGCCSSNESQSSSRFQSSRFGELGAVRPPRAHRSPVLSPTNASLAVSLALSAVRVGVLELEFLRHGTPLQALMLLDGSGPLHPFLELDAPNGNGAALCNQRTSSTATPAWRSPPWRPLASQSVEPAADYAVAALASTRVASQRLHARQHGTTKSLLVPHISHLGCSTASALETVTKRSIVHNANPG
jgi:hypothetical protein